MIQYVAVVSSVVLKGTVPAPVPSGSMRKRKKKLFLAKTVVETCRTPDPPKTTRRCVCVCVCVCMCLNVCGLVWQQLSKVGVFVP